MADYHERRREAILIALCIALAVLTIILSLGYNKFVDDYNDAVNDLNDCMERTHMLLPGPNTEPDQYVPLIWNMEDGGEYHE